MFDSPPLDQLDARAAAQLIAEQHRTRVTAECRLLELAAHWADLHGGPIDPGSRRVSGERGRTPGGEGTPVVREFAAAELGAHLETTTGAAWELMGDALDLRHRLPRLWLAVREGRVRAWKARRIAHETRQLSRDAARQVDAAVDGLVTAVSWARFENLLAARIAEADPAGEEARLAAWEAERFVRAGRATERGLKLLVARAAAGDVIWFLAMVDRIAEILAAEGDADPIDVRRSKAIGVLARPDHALDLLRRHVTPAGSQPDPESGSEPDPEHDGHVSVDLTAHPADPRVSRPRVELVVHVATETMALGDGPARVEGVGPMTLRQVRRWLTETGCAVSVRPVIDLTNELGALDGYEVPRTMRRFIGLSVPASTFPFSGHARGSLADHGLDLDHVEPYRSSGRNGRPGQTRVGNLGPLSRAEHRLKTHSRWQVRQPEPGAQIWRSPTGHHWLTTPHAGTYALGRGRLAQAIWRAVGDEHDARVA